MFPNLTSAFAGFSTYLKNSPGMLIDLSFGNGLLGHLGSCFLDFQQSQHLINQERDWAKAMHLASSK